MNIRKAAAGLLAAGVLAVGLSVGAAGKAQAEEAAIATDVYFAPVHFIFDGEELDPPEGQRAFLYKNVTYVPLRFASHSLGMAIDWDPDAFKVTVREAATVEEVAEVEAYVEARKVGDREILPVDGSALEQSQIEAYFKKVKYVFGQRSVSPSAELPGILVDNSLYVPLRFMSESLGTKLEWEGSTYTITAQETVAGARPYEEIVLEAQAGFDTLVSGFKTEFFSLKLEYDKATDDTAVDVVLEKGAKRFIEVQGKFDAEVLQPMLEALRAGNYYEGAAESLKKEYEEQKDGLLSLVEAFTGKPLAPYLEAAGA